MHTGGLVGDQPMRGPPTAKVAHPDLGPCQLGLLGACLIYLEWAAPTFGGGGGNGRSSWAPARAPGVAML